MFIKYSQQQKIEVLRRLESRTTTMTELAAELGVSRSTLHRWAREMKISIPHPIPGELMELKRNLRHLQEENQRLREEVLLLRRVAGLYFAQHPDGH